MQKLTELEDLVLLVNSKNNPFDNYSTVKDKTILAIAEAFRALEQRAEAAEAEIARLTRNYKHIIEQHMPRTSDGCDKGWTRVIEAHELQVKLEAAEAEAKHQLNVNIQVSEHHQRLVAERSALQAKLAELEKQEPVAYTDAEELETMRKGTYADMFNPCDEYKSDPQWIPLFTRPAPAADLAELVPDEVDNWKNPASEAMRDIGYVGSKQDFTVGANWMRAAILRNIERMAK